MTSIRRAFHASTWYSSSPNELSSQLNNWLNMAGDKVHGPARAIITPHAGYRYCGACAAHGFKEIDPSQVKRIFVLGPSHHVKLSGCAVTSSTLCETPLYNLKVDRSTNDELFNTGCFEQLSLSVEEDEHSIEMQLPFIAKVMENHDFTIIPVMVGHLSSEKAALYGKIFAPYLADPSNLFVISTDFCHWGSRFNYQFYEKDWGKIYESIQKLDEMGMRVIEKMNPDEFTNYLREYANTICGRYAVIVLLHALQNLQNNGNHNMSLKFLNYAQSSKCLDHDDSSVSYAAASLKFS